MPQPPAKPRSSPLSSLSHPRLIFLNRVYWPSSAATAQLLTDLAEGLAARGWPVHVIAAGHDAGPNRGVVVHRTGSGDRHAGLISRWWNYRRFRRRAREQLAALVQPGDIVIPLTDPPMLGSAVAPTALSRGARVVHWIQDIYPEIVTAHVGAVVSLPLLPLRGHRDAAWRAASGCVALSDAMAQAVADRGVSTDRIAVIGNWAPHELDIPAAPGAIAARRAAWGVSDRFVVAYSGNLGRVHEFAALLDAADRLRTHPEIVFLFIGTGARLGEIRAAVAARSLANVRFLPAESRDHLAAALAAADAQCVTLKPGYERLVFPSKLAGALAAGRPVLFVGSPESEIARLLKREDCGAAFAPDGDHQLAETIAHWLADPALRLQLGHRARAAYERHFTLAAALDRWEALLRRTVSSG